jgi:hypothetical protein
LARYAPKVTAGIMWVVICILICRAKIETFSLYAGCHS